MFLSREQRAPCDNDQMSKKPRIGITLGDINGIGPEVAVRAVLDERVLASCEPIVLAPRELATEVLRRTGQRGVAVDDAGATGLAKTNTIVCSADSEIATPLIEPSQVTAAAGLFAYDSLCRAIRLAQAGELDAICTAPINKAALAAAGVSFPGHTEILADECGVDDFAMMLHLSAPALAALRSLLRGDVKNPAGLAIAHVTLHTSIASVPQLFTRQSIVEKTGLVHNFLKRLGIVSPRIGVCALNPHAGEDGLFGSEETEVITPAVNQARYVGFDAHGPFPADTLIRRAILGEFHGVVAMYHDQGHIPVKLIGFDQAINVTLGIPIVRTSPTHGTAFDIAWQGVANPCGMIEAVLLATELAERDD